MIVDEMAIHCVPFMPIRCGKICNMNENFGRDPLFDTLNTVFGFQSFRPNQESIVRAVLGGSDVFAVMPTGGGKSLCYQLPAAMMKGTAVIISPLISLMKDQVDAAVENGISAAFMNSSMNTDELTRVYLMLS